MSTSTPQVRTTDGIETTTSGVGRWWVYLAVAVGGTWAFWLPAIALGVRFDSAVGLVLLLVGLAVPGVTGIAFSTSSTTNADGPTSGTASSIPDALDFAGLS
jgi:hypothetical protein